MKNLELFYLKIRWSDPSGLPKGKVFIPNRELMFKYEELLRSEKSLGYVYRLANISDQMLKATLSGDTDRMAEILQLAHNTETPILSYNNETELAAVVNLVYLSARDRYRVEREDKAGKGFVDFIFYPENPADTGLILELKAGHSPEEAIRQIREKQYALRFKGKPGEKERYTGQILGVGISYSKDTLFADSFRKSVIGLFFVYRYIFILGRQKPDSFLLFKIFLILRIGVYPFVQLM